MKKVGVVVFVSLLLAAPALAQDGASVRRRASFFGAPGVLRDSEVATVHVGGGVEAVWSSGLGLSFDTGYVRALGLVDVAAFSFSPGIVFELPVDAKIEPFARGGVMLLAADGGAAGLWSVGGGLDYRIRDDMTLRAELRNSFEASAFRRGLVDIRIGLAFDF